MVACISSTFVLADLFDVEPMALVPDFLYDQELICDYCINGKVEAINQYHQDVLIDCPHCKGEGLSIPVPSRLLMAA